MSAREGYRRCIRCHVLRPPRALEPVPGRPDEVWCTDVRWCEASLEGGFGPRAVPVRGPKRWEEEPDPPLRRAPKRR